MSVDKESLFMINWESMTSFKRGFTIFEILIVIVIIALLAALSFPSIVGAIKRGRDSKLKAEMNNFKSALRTYYNDYQRYPANDINMKILGCGTGGTGVCPNTTCIGGSSSSIPEFATGTDCSVVYMNKLPKPTAQNKALYYGQLGSGDSFSLCAYLENQADPDGPASLIKCTNVVPAPIPSGSVNIFCVCSD